MPDLGKKHECPNCGIKFYDLGKPEPLCPRCGTDVRKDEQAEAGKASQTARRRRQVEVVSEGEAEEAADTEDFDDAILDEDEDEDEGDHEED